MKNIKYFLVILFNFLVTIVFSQYQIHEDTYAYIYENSDIEIYTAGSDITIQGEYYCNNKTNSNYGVTLTPFNDNVITFSPPDKGRGFLDQDYSRIGVGNEDEKKQFKNTQTCILYPNPSKSILNIAVKQPIKTLGVVNVFGVKQPVNKKENTLIIEDYKKGMYYLIIQLNNGKVLTKSFIKE